MSHDPKECRARAANCIDETSRCIEVKDRDPLYKFGQVLARPCGEHRARAVAPQGRVARERTLGPTP
jgi:hypothetical protein